MKPFNLELAKTGHPVCTRNGHKARIISFDKKDEKNKYTIVALVSIEDDFEELRLYANNGAYDLEGETNLDLMMVSENKEGWINIYKSENSETFFTGTIIHETKEVAENYGNDRLVQTIKIQWEE